MKLRIISYVGIVLKALIYPLDSKRAVSKFGMGAVAVSGYALVGARTQTAQKV
jgi:hypothetical protein